MNLSKKTWISQGKSFIFKVNHDGLKPPMVKLSFVWYFPWRQFWNLTRGYLKRLTAFNL